MNLKLADAAIAAYEPKLSESSYVSKSVSILTP